MCEMDAAFRNNKNGPKSLRGFKIDLLKQIGITPTKSYYAFMTFGKKSDGTEVGDFFNTISAEQGIFFANANDRGERKEHGVITQQPVAYQMSTIAWWLWKHTVMASHAHSVKEDDEDFSDLRYFFRVNIKNEETAEILQHALGDENGPKDFTPEDESQNNAFWPILGSANGNGIVWFLADHKKSLKGRTIEKITVWLSEEDHSYNFWATIR